MTSAVSTAIAQVEDNQKRVDLGTPTGLVEYYTPELKELMPTHVKADQFMRAALASLKFGKKSDGRHFDLETAARTSPQTFVTMLRTAARLGLTPGTEEFYVTPRKVKGKWEILGIVGYQGYIELMYRAGAVQSVVAECVYAKDVFRFSPGQDEMPVHLPDWFGEDRGELIGVYAYAKMKGGATSKVVILNRRDIEKIKSKSQGANSEYSPWQTDTDKMWLKSAVRQLRKWVPTSTEYRDSLARAEHAGSVPVIVPGLPVEQQGQVEVPDHHQVQVDDVDEVIDAELEPMGDEEPPGEEDAAPTESEATEPAAAPEPGVTKAQLKALRDLFTAKGFHGVDDRQAYITDQLQIEVKSSNDLTAAQAKAILAELAKLSDPEPVTPEVPVDVPADGAAQ